MEKIPAQIKSFIKKAEEKPEKFWDEAAENAFEDIYWFRKWDKVFEQQYPTFKWYLGGITNISYNCLDYKVKKGLGDKPAFIYESGESGKIEKITYSKLLDFVRSISSGLRALGVKKGDRVVIYMPINITSVATMLACARIGALHVVIFAGFSPKAVADRIIGSGAEYIITQSFGLRRGRRIEIKKIIDEAVEQCPLNQIKRIVVYRENGEKSSMKKDRDIYFEDFLKDGKNGDSDFVKLEANEPLFLLPTSGTTAKPKIAVHCHGGYQIYIYCMGKWVYGLKNSDVWFSTSDIGWIVGHSYSVYAPLLIGCTSILYEGTPDYPHNDMWWSIIERNKVTGVFTSPTGVRALMKLGIEQPRKHDLGSLERVFVAGEVLNPEAWKWLYKEVLNKRIPVLDHMWQTESSGPMVANFYGLGLLPVKPGSAGIPVPGLAAYIVDETTGESLPPDKKGIFVVRKPFPGLTPILWQDLDGYKQAYWEKTKASSGMYYTGDAAWRDTDGYIYFAGRADEVIKIASHRIGTVEIESVLMSHPSIVEAGVSGVPDELRGEVACAFAVLKKGYKPSEELKKELIKSVRESLGAIVVVRDIEFVTALPKTRSGKIMRRVMKTLWLKKDLGDISTIEEEASVEEIKEAIGRIRKA
ncbi:MAG: acetyl-CoA synthetase [Euryarchaeota archaeon CG01_land_8_20_14_3_00_38_12]|nr:MAG: acetyl-CoA synthetase [Euryarchaeota archaeon CG01_land_8_20_14_3_00_38_12]